jgi:hypothetical protein
MGLRTFTGNGMTTSKDLGVLPPTIGSVIFSNNIFTGIYKLWNLITIIRHSKSNQIILTWTLHIQFKQTVRYNTWLIRGHSFVFNQCSASSFFLFEDNMFKLLCFKSVSENVQRQTPDEKSVNNVNCFTLLSDVTYISTKSLSLLPTKLLNVVKESLQRYYSFEYSRNGVNSKKNYSKIFLQKSKVSWFF